MLSFPLPEKISLTVAQKELITQNIIKLKFECDHVLDFLPGQFVILVLDRLTRRSYSISSLPGKNFIETYNDITPGGPGSKFFENASIGDRVEAVFPLGRFVYKQNAVPTVFIATGTGITPVMAMLKAGICNDTAGRQLRLVWGAKAEADLFLKPELDKLQNDYPGFKAVYCVSREPSTALFAGRVTDYVNSGNVEIESDFYICGSQSMIKDVENILLCKGVPKENIKYERFY